MRCRRRILVALFVFAIVTPLARAQDQDAAAAIDERSVNIVSEGVRMQGTLYYRKDVPGPLPTIILSHGWGGTAAMLRYQAAEFANRAGKARKRRNYDELAKPLIEVQLVQVQPGQSRSGQAGSECCHSSGDWRVRSVHSE
jgi:hypothetical protein